MKEVFERLQHISESFYELLDINIFILDLSGSLVYESKSKSLTNPFQMSFESVKSQFFDSLEQNNLSPQLRETSFLENYVFIKIVSEKQFQGAIVIGPVFSKKRTLDELTQILYDNNIYQNHATYLEYLQNINVVSIDKLVHISSIFFTTINQSKLSFDTLRKQFTQFKDNAFIEETYESKRIHEKINEQVTYDMKFENHLLMAIENGDTESIATNLESIFDIDQAILSKKSLLRSVKNKAIASVALASRTAISAGLDPETSFTMSNHYIQFIEDLDNVTSIKEAIITFFSNYAEKVSEVKTGSISKTILHAQNYISQNIFENPKISEIAKNVNLSTRHLSRVFKKEVGIPISEYILIKKIQEAKKMLTFTNYSISEISFFLGFLDQSHFAKRFKSICGVTPLKFRHQMKK